MQYTLESNQELEQTIQAVAWIFDCSKEEALSKILSAGSLVLNRVARGQSLYIKDGEELRPVVFNK